MKLAISVFFENLSRKFKFHEIFSRTASTIHEDRYTFLIITRSVLLLMRNISDESCREIQNTHFVFSNFLSENCNVYEIMWKNCRAGQAIDDNMARAHCMLHT